jgi:hypothetical protein
MRKLLSALLLAGGMAFGLPAAADHLDGVVPLVKDDIAAVAKVKAMPERHVMLYFGDNAN